MSEKTCITIWLEQLKEGERSSVQRLWECYYPKLVRVATKKLQGMPQHLTDGEEVALSAFKSFCLAAEKKRFPKLEDRDDLWQVLLMLVRNKVADQWEFHSRSKRDLTRTQSIAGGESSKTNGEVAFLCELLESGEPDPLIAIEVAEECQRLMNLLPDDEARQIALWKMEGYTNKEIAEKIQRVEKTVERRLGLIRSRWQSSQLPQ